MFGPRLEEQQRELQRREQPEMEQPEMELPQTEQPEMELQHSLMPLEVRRRPAASTWMHLWRDLRLSWRARSGH